MKQLLALLLAINLSASTDLARELIILHEGFVSTPYNDNGHLAIGYGTQLRFGISQPVALILLENRLLSIENSLLQFNWYHQLNNTRKAVIIDMCYNLGITGLLNFKHMIYRLKHSYWHGAANAMRDSLWYNQVGSRAKHLYRLMYDGHY